MKFFLSLVLLVATASCARPAPYNCSFSGDRETSLPPDAQTGVLLLHDLARYRATTRQLPKLPNIYGVTVRARTAVLVVGAQDPTLPGGMMYGVPEANDFRYAQAWQRFYDAAHHTSGACVRMLLEGRDGPIAQQQCWGGEGQSCTNAAAQR